MTNLTHNLPHQLTPIIGREKEIGDLIELLKNPEIRLITLHGFGGTGKTRLALELGRLAMENFEDGVWFVSLAPLNSADHILTATASALQFDFGSSVDQKQQLFSYLEEKNILLTFDNIEHLLPEASLFLEELLQNTHHLRVLVTSRQPLNTSWEWSFLLRGLDYQDESLEQGETAASTRLFLQHLRREGQTIGREDTACAAQISRLVNGLPLALILAASWGRVLGCEEIAGEIRKGIGILNTRGQRSSDKHGSMQAVFDYSWRLLSDHERAVLRKLSIFRGGFDRAAANAVAGADLATLATLVDQAFIERAEHNRYQIHELLRQYLHDQLLQAQEEQSTREAHTDY
ncbi:MAG: ATP-binding protein, partial [Bacteroidota bacterium]